MHNIDEMAKGGGRRASNCKVLETLETSHNLCASPDDTMVIARRYTRTEWFLCTLADSGGWEIDQDLVKYKFWNLGVVIGIGLSGNTWGRRY